MHLPGDNLLPRLYLYIGIGAFASTSLLYLSRVLYINGIFSGNGWPRAIISSHARLRSNDKVEAIDTPFRVRLILPRPVMIKAGQYVNLWLPSISFWSWAQTHPFTVISWSQGKQSVLELLVQPREGLTATIARQARAIGRDGFSSLALYSGPHGLSEPVDDYETVLLISSGAGLSAVIPYAKRLIYGYNTCTSHVRRVHLIWQVETRGRSVPRRGDHNLTKTGVAIAAQEQLNELLKEDVLDGGYVGTTLTV